MKKAILFAIVALVVLLAVGCEKTFSYTYTDYCYEITTSSGVVKTALELTYEESECDRTDAVGTCETEETWAGETVTQTIVVYDGDYYDEEYCTDWWEGTWADL